MNVENAWVGIDVSQATLDVAIYPHGHHLQVSNDDAGITELLTYLQAYTCELVVLESTGGLERLVLTKLSEAGIPAARVNPRRVRAYATALGVAKTDALDAQVLAKFASAFEPDPQTCPEPDAQALSDLVSRRRQLVEMQVAEKNRLARASDAVRPVGSLIFKRARELY
jgi:transposase